MFFEDPDQDAHVRHPTEKAWQVPPPHGATTIPVAAPPGINPQELPHPLCPGIRYHTGHLGRTDWWLQHNDSDRDQDHQPGVLSQQYGIQGAVLEVDPGSGWV